MAYVEKSARTVEEAIAAALAELRIGQEEADIEILQKANKGFLGIGRKDAKVRVRPKSEALHDEEGESVQEATDAAVKAVKNAASVAAAAFGKRMEEAKGEAGKRFETSRREAGRRFSEVREEAGRRFHEAREEAGKRFAEAKADAIEGAIGALEDMRDKEDRPYRREPRRYAQDEEAIAKAKEFLQKIFQAMQVDVVLEKFVSKYDGTVTFRLYGSDMGILIGKHGQTLDSLQYLTNLVANKNSTERVRIIIDVEDYRDRRVETLNRLAYRLAGKVKKSGQRVALEPMNPHERKIIHMALQGDRRVTTLSEGDEPYRHVVIELKK